MGTKVFRAQLSHLYEMLAFIKAYGNAQKIPSSPFSQIILASEEALVNVINYAYPGNDLGTVEIDCSSSTDQKGIKIVIKDHGIPFNPLENIPTSLPTPNRLLEKTNNVVGGYGIYILTGIMDQVDYQRLGDINILTLVKHYS